MKILVDKMPSKASACLFNEHRTACVSRYCMLTNKPCGDVDDCCCLKVNKLPDFLKKEFHMCKKADVEWNDKCPRCGKRDTSVDYTGNSLASLYYVKCNNCGFTTDFHATRDEAVEEWNQRHNEKKKDKIIYVDELPKHPQDCQYSIGKATPFDCDYDECTIDGKHCNDTSKCKHLRKKGPYTPFMYQQQAAATADPMLTREKALVEGLVGINSEAGEALDIWKKYEFHKHDLDKKAIALELGDVLWYLTEAAVALGYSLEDIMKMNIEKLQERYPDGFDPERSKNREEK